ncbi:MAG: hypothetical protein ACOCWQ_03495 [Nanoarchaeota archaeon]
MVEDQVGKAALEVWEKEQQGAVDKYAYLAFQFIGIAGIAASSAATFWGGFKIVPGYIVIFFVSLLFLIGGVAWVRQEKPSKEALQKLHEYELNQMYKGDFAAEDVINERRRRRDHEEDLAERRYEKEYWKD